MGVVTEEHAIGFACEGARLIGIVHGPRATARQGVVIVLGGAQYRVGSHRQFLILARTLAAAGVAVLTFDHRGLGDSDGPFRGFEHLDADIRSAVDALTNNAPALEEVVLFGLCDGASAISFYAHQDPRVTGVVLINPWVRSAQSYARAYARSRYLARLRDPVFWRALLTGRINPFRLVASVLGTARAASGAEDTPDAGAPSIAIEPGGEPSDDPTPLPDRMARGLARFRGRVLVILSGQDLTAQEFVSVAGGRDWRKILSQSTVTQRRLEPADHTYSRAEWRDRVHGWVLEWLSAGAARQPMSGAD